MTYARAVYLAELCQRFRWSRVRCLARAAKHEQTLALAVQEGELIRARLPARMTNRKHG